jgi:hypothetical protein
MGVVSRINRRTLHAQGIGHIGAVDVHGGVVQVGQRAEPATVVFEKMPWLRIRSFSGC